MNRLRKIARWFWLSKERMVLAIMVIFLSFRVYQIVQPAPESDIPGKDYRAPGSQLPPDVETPGTPPRVPPPLPPENWTNLWRRSPFIYVATGASSRQGNDSDTKIDLDFLSIQEVTDDIYKVRLRSPSGRRGWYAEGDLFEAYEVIAIDPEGPCVTIFSEELGRSEEICKKE